MRVLVERCGGKIRVEEFPRTEEAAINQYYSWIRFYNRQKGFTMITIELPTMTRSVRIASGIISVIKEGPLCYG